MCVNINKILTGPLFSVNGKPIKMITIKRIAVISILCKLIRKIKTTELWFIHKFIHLSEVYDVWRVRRLTLEKGWDSVYDSSQFGLTELTQNKTKGRWKWDEYHPFRIRIRLEISKELINVKHWIKFQNEETEERKCCHRNEAGVNDGENFFQLYQGKTNNRDVIKRDVKMLWNGDNTLHIWSTFEFFRTSEFRQFRLNGVWTRETSSRKLKRQNRKIIGI